MTASVAVERAKQVFRFLRAFAEKGEPAPRRLSDHHWVQRLVELPAHPSIVIGEVNLGDSGTPPDGEAVGDAPLLTIRRPAVTPAPDPPLELVDFIATGWRDPERPCEMLEAREFTVHGVERTERLADDPRRVEALAAWKSAWTAWADAERPARRAMRVFERFYELKGRIDRESERVELLLGDGRLRWNANGHSVDHPVLLQRVDLVFDLNAAEFRVIDADRGPELYGQVLDDAHGMAAARMHDLRAELERGGFHPLATDGTRAFLRRVAQALAAGGVFEASAGDRPATARPAISRDPVLFLRTRASGFPAAFDRVLEDLERSNDVPVSLSRLVGVDPQVAPDVDAGEWSPWGEPTEVLLSKHANDEQVHIARALERHKAVLVQGPPGTGKSHTIANLVGHLVAHGKRVLVTSHTTKALRVLRSQIVEALRPLCVALLDDDLAGRAQMEEAVKGILARLTTSTEGVLEQEVEVLAEARVAVNGQLSAVTRELRVIRESEYLPIPVGGDATAPSDASRWMRANATLHAWIPGPVDPGAALPVGAEELRELYHTHGGLTPDEETELAAGLPEPERIPDDDEMRAVLAALDATEPAALARFWERDPQDTSLAGLQRLARTAASANDQMAHLERWQRAIVAIGYTGGADVGLWTQLAALVDDVHESAQGAKPLVLASDPKLPADMPHDQAAHVARELEERLQAGGGLGGLTLLFHADWKAFLGRARCNGRAPATLTDMKALRARAELEAARDRLAVRWMRQAEPIGMPAFSALGAEPERRAQEYTAQIAGWLMRWRDIWPRLQSAAHEAGFRWEQFRARSVARGGPADPFDRDMAILAIELPEAIEQRRGVCERALALRKLADLEEVVGRYKGPCMMALARAVRSRDATGYAMAREALRELAAKAPIVKRREELLAKLRHVAPGWAGAIRRREGAHAGTTPPGDAMPAWRWRQFEQELSRRAAADDDGLVRALGSLREELHTVTANLVDRMAWLAQMRRVDLGARQALQGWAQIQKRIGKGTGKRVPMLQAEARGLLARARDAVPVWIMPLNRVAESFDATRGKFDVVIIDEASQSDVTGLLAWYLGERVAVVGDHEQVSPSAIGERVEDVERLIAHHLAGVPNAVLYDGKQSVYDLARASFGGTIALREHFRCVPEIIDFSNHLSYNGDIRPLRDPTRVPGPHVVEFKVDGVRDPDGRTNLPEARSIVALMAALVETPAFARASLGAISLLGDEQASLIQSLALDVLGAVELARRRFTAGNAAQFQGDERDVIFLSMVDSPAGQPLRVRQDDTTKQRYNVAVSRARNHLWLVHSLDPYEDLQAGDLRRRLIEHARNPGGLRAALERVQERPQSPLEDAILERLRTAGYRVTPQVWVGQYRLDLVVADARGQVAVECDGDRVLNVEHIPADMARQAVLERAGWRFVRVRGSRFYADPDATMRWVFAELDRLKVRPVGDVVAGGARTTGGSVHEGVIERAMEIMHAREWAPLSSLEPTPEPDAQATAAG